MLKSNSNKIMLCGGGGNIILFWIKFQRNDYTFLKYLYNFESELNNIFHGKGLIRFTFKSNWFPWYWSLNSNGIEPTFLELDSWSPKGGFYSYYNLQYIRLDKGKKIQDKNKFYAYKKHLTQFLKMGSIPRLPSN